MVSCFTIQDISTLNQASVYRTSEKKFHPEFVAFNQNDSSVKLFVKLIPSEFLFIRHQDESFKANFRIYSEIISSYESTGIIDSATAEFSFDLNEKSGSRFVSMEIPIKLNGNFLIRTIITDINKDVADNYFVPLDRLSKASRNDFLVTGKDSVPMFRNYVYNKEKVSIVYRDKSVNIFWCKYYKRDFPLATPPFAFDVRTEFDYRPDNAFAIEKSNMIELSLNGEGFFHFQLDSVGKSGLTIFKFVGSFPDITSPKQMIEAARYLTTKKEFEELKKSPSPKSAIDNFWLEHGGNQEKTRALIKKYYGRIREANNFFTSYTEGWRTDRGMIYTLFGSPGTVLKSSESETWIYGTPNSTLALNYFFIKVNNPFSDNDFMLSRSPNYESNWYKAIEVWRQGRPYNSFY
jgi:GWxTD domain-containing protein